MGATDQILVFEWTSAWRVIALVVIVAGAAFLSWLGLRGSMSRGRRRFLILLRSINLLLVAALLLGPALEHRKVRRIRDRIALLVDTSESMQVTDGDKSRIQKVRDFISRQAGELERLGSSNTMNAYEFSDRLTPLAIEQLGKSPEGKKSDYAVALSSLIGSAEPAASSSGSSLAAVIVIGDGADTESLSGTEPNDDLPATFMRLLSSLGCPVNTIAVGDQHYFSDLAIEDVTFDDFAFIRNAVEVQVKLRSTGIDKTTVPVSLVHRGRALATRAVTISKGDTRTVSLRFVPDDVGKFVYRVSTPVLAEETISENNSLSFVTRIIRDKIRVLHVVGRPSWDQRFLRELMKRNPNIDLVSFYILRTTIDAPGVGERELSLIPFPVNQLFGSELDTFDVLVFQNFNHGPYSVGFYLGQIVDYVRGGGAFCMIGGDLSFGSGGYGDTPLEEILPVSLSRGDDYRLDEIRPVSTSTGQRHPVLDMGGRDVFGKLPPLGSYNRVSSVHPDADVLLAHPFERIDSRRAPLLALREVGRGRSAAVLTDGTWHWSFSGMEPPGNMRPYHRLWNNLLRWLIRDPALQPASLRSEKVRYSPEEPVSIALRVRNTPAGKVRLLLRRTTGGEVIERRLVDLDTKGFAQVEIASPGAGAYIIEAVDANGEAITGANEAFVVEGTGVERTRPFPRPDLLEKIAEASGGSFTELGAGSLADIMTREGKQFRVEASTTRPLLQYWWCLAGMLVLLGCEWWIRRRWGFS